MITVSSARFFFLTVVAFVLLTLVFHQQILGPLWPKRPSSTGKGPALENPVPGSSSLVNSPSNGTSKGPGSDYSHHLVVPRTKSEDVDWIQTELPNMKTFIYTVDDPAAALKPPVNKGHEAMVYLTYIVDHYDQLADVTTFVHSHQIAYHNNDLLQSDMPRMLRRLNLDLVTERGYFNLRCHHEPGCPDWLHTDAKDENINRKEEVVFSKIWDSLHPGVPLPPVLSVPCCSQFAASRARLQSLSLAEWKRYQQWLIKTDLNDDLSGRVWEYTWHYILTGQAELCPSMHRCYCDGYRVCFPSEDRFEAWMALQQGVKDLRTGADALDEKKEDSGDLRKKIGEIQKTLNDERNDALRRGDAMMNK